MPAVAKSPITTLCEALNDSPLLRLARVPVYLGRDKLGQASGPRRIVVYCAGGSYVPPELAQRRNSAPPPLADLDQSMVAKIWAEGHDEAWDIQRRFFQALYRNSGRGGPLYRHGTADDDSEDDSSTQGEALTIRFRLVLPIERVDESEATIATVTNATYLVDPADSEDEQAGPTITIT